MGSSSTFTRISSANRDIGMIPASLKSDILSPNRQVCRQGQGFRRGCCPSSHTDPCKTLSPTRRLTLLGSDFPCLQQYDVVSSEVALKRLKIFKKVNSNAFQLDGN
ncbi:hypothetical protein AVEN_44737-1 [Araneus ventricosus]|uniref:Uncharacterized protein n=1 Tax=Araneus ventricosus TaxID=182803 RepID=A0A4Y2M2Y6_ARAVE|nr:hypothetical protein AVEN_44737-1 [Araneus ventricosus]